MRFHVRWTTHLGVTLDEAEVNGKEAVKAQIIKWVNEEFGDDGDQIHVTQLPIRRKRNE